MMINLIGKPCFFIRAIISLAINKAISKKRKVAISFLKLFLW